MLLPFAITNKPCQRLHLHAVETGFRSATLGSPSVTGRFPGVSRRFQHAPVPSLITTGEFLSATDRFSGATPQFRSATARSPRVEERFLRACFDGRALRCD